MTVSREEFDALREQVEVLQIALGTATGRADGLEAELNRVRGRAAALQTLMAVVATIPGARENMVSFLEEAMPSIKPEQREGAESVLTSIRQAPENPR